jgi:hypothetical protein
MLVDFGRAYLIFPRKFWESLRHPASASARDGHDVSTGHTQAKT